LALQRAEAGEVERAAEHACHLSSNHTSASVSIRQHTSADVSIRAAEHACHLI
jgi:hypothetical protein